MIKRERGFTLIELLVVIAIIGILSSVVLASLNTARGKGNNAKIKAQLSGARAGAEIFYDNVGSYTGLCGSSDPAVLPYLTSANYPGSPAIECNATGAAYAIQVPLATAEGTNNAWCVDSVGKSMGKAAVVDGATSC